jgi:6-phosphogluconolactonase
MNIKIQIISDPDQLSSYIASCFKEISYSKEKCCIALSGGETPRHIFNFISNSEYKKNIKWNKIHFFWCDERCVPPEHPESNFGMTSNLLFKNISISKKNIHRIQGEFDPKEELLQSTDEILESVKLKNGIPAFDWILLGLGSDGHTASIFPNAMELFQSKKIYESAIHPKSGQKRITLTPMVINNADKITFIVTGEEKKYIVDKILNKKEGYEKYPAGLIKPLSGMLEWVLDEKAGDLL